MNQGILEKIILASPRGFCAGVERAIDVVEDALELSKKEKTKIYVNHEIVHNKSVVEELEEKGAEFIEDINNVPDGSFLIYSAHGVPPSLRREAEKRNLRTIDATCPLVEKVHKEAIKFYNEGYDIILIGHKGHQEVIATTGVVPMSLVERKEDVYNLDLTGNKIGILTQTTLSEDDTYEIVNELKLRYKNIEFQEKSNICYATQNRQDAIKSLTRLTNLILVVGSSNSSNSNRLVETAKNCGVNSYLIENHNYIQDEWINGLRVLGISSGASVPESLVNGVLDKLKKYGQDTIVETLETIKEDVHFSKP